MLHVSVQVAGRRRKTADTYDVAPTERSFAERRLDALEGTGRLAARVPTCVFI